MKNVMMATAMTSKSRLAKMLLCATFLCFHASLITIHAQTVDPMPADSVKVMAEAVTDSVKSVAGEVKAIADSTVVPIDQLSPYVVADSMTVQKMKRDWATWRPNPKKALWLALVLPGAGQIYNRKYWKLPIIYGGFVGCIYALTWNNTMYKDYSQAYIDISDNDPETASYNKFLHLGQEITSANESRYKEIFKNRKDKYRRWRDLSFFCLIGVYALSVIDAYVDAELSEFDISDDLSLRIEPAVINSGTAATLSPSSAVGVHCSFSF